MYELCKEFKFESAHMLKRKINNESSNRIHGHSYRVEIIISGKPNIQDGMIEDAELLESKFLKIKNLLNHKVLNEIEGLSIPTMENISFFIWKKLKASIPTIVKVTVFRDSLAESCSYSERN